MEEDLVKRLYNEAIKWEGSSPEGLLIRAGDEILKLRKQLSNQLDAVVKPAKADKEIEELKRALRVIYTWATFEGGIALVPDHVEKLIKKINIKP